MKNDGTNDGTNDGAKVELDQKDLEAAMDAVAAKAAQAALETVRAEREKAEAERAEAEKAKEREAEEAKAVEEAEAAQNAKIEALVEAKVAERIEKSKARVLDTGVPARPGTLVDKLDDESRQFVGTLKQACSCESRDAAIDTMKDYFKSRPQLRAPLNTGDGEGTGSSHADYMLPTVVSDMIVTQEYEKMEFVPLCRQFTPSKIRGVVPKLGTVSVVSKAEGASYTESTPTLSRDQWYAYSFGAFAKLTMETIEDTEEYDIVALIRDEFSGALAAEKDKQMLIGQNSDAPYGLYYTSGLSSYAAGGALSYDVLVELEYTLAKQYRDTEACVWVGSDTNLKRIRKLKDSDNRPIFERAYAPGVGGDLNKGMYPRVMNYKYVNAGTHVPNNYLFFGRPNDYWIWNRKGIVMDLSDKGYDGSNDAWLNDEFWLKIKERYDGLCARTQGWVYADGITG